MIGGVVLEVYVLPRVHERHPDLDVTDVLKAFASVMVDARRSPMGPGPPSALTDAAATSRWCQAGRRSCACLPYHDPTDPGVVGEINRLRGEGRNQ